MDIYSGYVYSDNNPVINFDCDGNSVISENCGKYRHKIRDALNKLKNIILSCRFLEYVGIKEDMLKKTNIIWIRCGEISGYRLNYYYCGYSWPAGDVITITKYGFYGVCGCLENVIFHEILHKLGFSEGDHQRMFCYQAQCVKCSGLNPCDYCKE